MTTLEIAVYGAVGLISVVLAVRSLTRLRERRPPEPAKGIALLSFTCAVLFIFILTRAWSTEGLGPDPFLLAAIAAGLFSTASALFACCAYLARQTDR